MEKAVQQHGTVACGQDKTVSVRPAGIPGAVAQEFCPENICHGRCSHWHSRVPGICLLDSVNRKETYGVNAELVDRGVLWIHARPRN